MKVPVMLLLSVEPAIDTDLEPVFAKLCLPTGIHFKDVWSRLRMKQDGTLFSSAVVTVMKIHKLSFVFLAPSGISTFPFFDIRFTKAIRLNKLLAHEDESKSPWLYSGYLAISALAVTIAMADEISPPLLLVANKYRWTISSSEPSKRDRPRGRHFKALLISRSFGSLFKFPFVKIAKSSDDAFV